MPRRGQDGRAARAGAANSVTPPSTLLPLALAMHRGGCSLIPTGKDKKPLGSWKAYQSRVADAQTIEAWAKNPAAVGFALVCGSVSGGVELLDFDDPAMYDHFTAALPGWAKAVAFPIQQTGGGGFQLAYRRPTPGGNKKLAWSPAVDADGVIIEGRQIGIETRGEGGYAVIPYSLHPSGNRYQPIAGDWADIPTLTDEQAEELLTLARSFDHSPKPAPAPSTSVPAPTAGAPAAAGGLTEHRRKYAREGFQKELDNLRTAREGGRDDALNAAAFAAGQLVASEGQLDEVQARQELEAAACTLGLEAGEVRATVTSGIAAGKGQPRDLSNVGTQLGQRTDTGRLETAPQQPQGYRLPTFPLGTQEGTDEANAVILATNGLGNRLRYTSGLGWLVYSAGVWLPSRDMVAANQVAGEVLREVVGQYLADAIRQRVDSDERARVGRWANSVCQTRTLSAALTAAAGKPEFHTEMTAWDAQPHLFNCLNGVLNLHTGDLLPHDPALLLTWQSGAVYDPQATHPNVDKLLELLEADGRAAFLQRTVGSALYGLAPNETLTVFQGEGGTGKGTLVSAVVAMLGDYATTLDVELLLDQKSGNTGTGPKPELLKLRGKRLAVAGEPQKGRRFNAGRVKGMTGNDPITARAMHSDVIVEFVPIFKLLIHTNYPIGAAHDDTGMQRRIKVVPFNARPTRADPNFKRVLETDPRAHSALLNWAYQGCRAWLAENYELGESAAIQQATAGYISDQNPYERFAAECLSFGPGLTIPSRQLEELFKEWCEENAVRHGVKVAELRVYLQQQGCERGRATGGGRKWQGVGASDTSDSSDTDSKVFSHTRIGLSKNLETAVTPVTAVTRDDVQPAAGWEGEEI